MIIQFLSAFTVLFYTNSDYLYLRWLEKSVMLPSSKRQYENPAYRNIIVWKNRGQLFRRPPVCLEFILIDRKAKLITVGSICHLFIETKIAANEVILVKNTKSLKLLLIIFCE